MKLTMRAGDPHPVSAGERAPTPHFDGHELVERLASEFTALEKHVVLVLDDLDELSSPETLAVQWLLERLPAALHELRLV